MSSHDRLILQSNIANHLKHLSDIDHLPTGQVKLSTSAGASVYADSNPPPQADPDGVILRHKLIQMADLVGILKKQLLELINSITTFMVKEANL